MSLTVWIALEVLGSKWRKAIGSWFRAGIPGTHHFRMAFYFPWFPSSLWPQVLEHHSRVCLGLGVVFIFVLDFSLTYAGVAQLKGGRGG